MLKLKYLIIVYETLTYIMHNLFKMICKIDSSFQKVNVSRPNFINNISCYVLTEGFVVFLVHSDVGILCL